MFRKLRIQGRMHIFEKMSQKALNRVLTLAKDSRGRELSKSSGIIDLQNVYFVNNSNTVNLEFWPQCHIFRFVNWTAPSLLKGCRLIKGVD